MDSSALRFRIGVFVLAALIVLAVLITMFSGLPNLFTAHNRYYAVFSTAAGVNTGTPVRRSGVRIGEVEGLRLDDETGNVRVTLLVDRKYPLRKDEVPKLSRNLLGDTTIDFVLAAKPQETGPAEPGTEFKGEAQPDTQVLLSQASDLLPSTQEAIRELGKAAKSFNDLAPSLDETIKELRALSKSTREMLPDLARTNDEARIAVRNWGKLGERLDVLVQTNQDRAVKTLEDLDDAVQRVARVLSDENQRNLSASLKNTRVASERFDSITANTDELLKESRRTMQHFDGTLTRTDEVLVNMQKLTKPLADRSATISKNLDESLDRLNKLLVDAQDLMRVLAHSNGTLAKLVNDPELYNNLNDVACMAAHMMPRLDHILRDFEVFSDKVARHPESLGVGGVVKPGSGIK